jgi:hypothetical protein
MVVDPVAERVLQVSYGERSVYGATLGAADAETEVGRRLPVMTRPATDAEMLMHRRRVRKHVSRRRLPARVTHAQVGAVGLSDGTVCMAPGFLHRRGVLHGDGAV